jgi:hypothetical protein
MGNTEIDVPRFCQFLLEIRFDESLERWLGVGNPLSEQSCGLVDGD